MVQTFGSEYTIQTKDGNNLMTNNDNDNNRPMEVPSGNYKKQLQNKL